MYTNARTLSYPMVVCRGNHIKLVHMLLNIDTPAMLGASTDWDWPVL